MIPSPVLTYWRRMHPWPTDEQVEQDLLLSQLAILLARHEALAECLVWRGGTCFHKLHLLQARRYSEDLDYVLVGRTGPTGWLADAIRTAAAESPLRVAGRQVKAGSVKVFLEGEAASGVTIRVKVEVNTDEVPPCMALARVPHTISTRWWTGAADIATFQPPELVGSKFRALAQRRKGRDLWDLWLARRELAIPDGDLAAAAGHYLRACGVSPSVFRARLAANVADPQFRSDLELVALGGLGDYDPYRTAAELILWSDEHLDPIWNMSRRQTAIERERRGWARHGWAPGAVRCPHYEVTRDGALRCPRWHPAGEACLDHPTAWHRPVPPWEICKMDPIR